MPGGALPGVRFGILSGVTNCGCEGNDIPSSRLNPEPEGLLIWRITRVPSGLFTGTVNEFGID
jgi:hypothetical protein